MSIFDRLNPFKQGDKAVEEFIGRQEAYKEEQIHARDKQMSCAEMRRIAESIVEYQQVSPEHLGLMERLGINPYMNFNLPGAAEYVRRQLLEKIEQLESK